MEDFDFDEKFIGVYRSLADTEAAMQRLDPDEGCATQPSGVAVHRIALDDPVFETGLFFLED